MRSRLAVVAGMLIYGTKESATVNAVLVVVKLLALALFLCRRNPIKEGSSNVAIPLAEPVHP